MTIRASCRFWSPSVMVLLLACSPEVVDVGGLEDQLAPPGEGAGCVELTLLGGPGGVVTERAELPRQAGASSRSGYSGNGDASGGVGAAVTRCPVPADLEFVITMDDRERLRETTTSPDAKQTVIHVYAHTTREPRVRVAQVDLSPAPSGQRRARFTNYAEVEQPIQLSFYDAADQPVGDATTPIAWGDTWIGTIPITAKGYRLGLTQPVVIPLPEVSTPEQEPADLPCVQAYPIGLVVRASLAQVVTVDPALLSGAHVQELYDYLPPLCTAK